LLLARGLGSLVHRSLAIVLAGGIVTSEVFDASTLRPRGPDLTIWLLRLVLETKPEDVDLEVVFELVAQFVTDVCGWDRGLPVSRSAPD
jgi:hypothetical protein